MSRLLFEKTGDAIYISHLDLMRVFQRAFRRAGFLIKHSSGFHQRAHVSLALPLSVGTESVCELLDFELPEPCPGEVLREKLNAVLPAGVLVREAYEGGKKLRELAFLQARLRLEYDGGVPEGAGAAVESLFRRPSLLLEKKTKRGLGEVDIIPMIHALTVCEEAGALRLEAVVSAQNPSLNPVLLSAAVERYLPALRPDFVRCRRLEVLDAGGNPFR